MRIRHKLKQKERGPEVKVREVVVIKEDERNKAQWKLGIITEPYPGRYGKVVAVIFRDGKSYLERAIQHLYPLEVSCDITAPTEEHTMNAEVEKFWPRRNVSEITRVRINDLANDNGEGPFNEQYLIADN